MATTAAALAARLARREIVVAPGIYDAFSAYQAERAGFEAVFVSGSALAAMHLARPDIGLLTASETAEIAGRIADRVSIPVLLDADQCFGNAHQAARAARLFERAGVAAIQIEDQEPVKPDAAPTARPLISAAAMADKIAAVKDALSGDTLVSARTDAMHEGDIDAGMARVHAYLEAGADIVFIEAVREIADMERLIAEVDGRAPVIYNALRESDPVTDAATLEKIGFSIALFPAVAPRAVGEALDSAFAALKTNPAVSASAPAADRIGAADYFARFKR